MSFSDDKSIERLALRLIDRSLPKNEWTHAGHFAVALWLTRHCPYLTRPDEVRTIITRYNDATHTANTDTSGYHHTITLASMRATRDYLTGFPSDTTLYTVLHSLLASEFGHPDWLRAYWERATLFSVTARRKWVEPDIMPLPF